MYDGKVESEEEYKEGFEIGKVAAKALGKVPVQKNTEAPEQKHHFYHKLKSFVNSSHRASGAHVIEDEDVVAERTKSFIYSNGLTAHEAELRLQKFGKNELPEIKIPKWYIFVSQLWRPMAIMIWIAAIIEGAIQNYVDMAILLFIIFANTSIGFYETTKAGDAIAALKKSMKPAATVKRDGKFMNIDAAFLVPGDLVLLGSGSAVPADCRVNEGEIDVDEAALTGESLPVTKYQGGDCKMGSTVVRGEVEATVETTGANTFFGRTAALLGVRFSFNIGISFPLLTVLTLFSCSKLVKRETSSGCC